MAVRNIAEGRRWLDEALAQARGETVECARALHTAGLLAVVQQAHSEARQLVKESLALSSSLSDEGGESWARLTLGLIEWMAEDPVEATRHLERSLAMHEAAGQRHGVSRALSYLAAAMAHTPSTRERGRKELERALRTAQALQDHWGEGFALLFLGLADADAGDRELAATRLRRALLTEALGPIRAGALEGLAQLATEEDPRRAMRLLGAATALRERQAGRPPAFIRRRAAAIRAQAQHQIDAGEAEQASNDGQRMTTEEALAYALENHEPRNDCHRQHSDSASPR